MPSQPTQDRDKTIERIARDTLSVQTLAARNRDLLDFHTLAVWSIKEALEQAYEAGRKAGPHTRVKCPACRRDIESQPL